MVLLVLRHVERVLWLHHNWDELAGLLARLWSIELDVGFEELAGVAVVGYADVHVDPWLVLLGVCLQECLVVVVEVVLGEEPMQVLLVYFLIDADGVALQHVVAMGVGLRNTGYGIALAHIVPAICGLALMLVLGDGHNFVDDDGWVVVELFYFVE